jgi:CxxC motif-containing protein (DUF1111 family)
MLLAASIANPLSCFPQTTVTATSTAAARDPGVRTGGNTGAPLPGLTAGQLALFKIGQTEFNAPEEVDEGLGPRMNLDSCLGCHAYPASGGSSPRVNPQVAFAHAANATNTIPAFITATGPVREVRFIKAPDGSPDGGVHSLFTLQGRTDAVGCTMAQPDFAGAVAAGNAIFRIPTPVFGAGLIEQIPDSAILSAVASNAPTRAALGIRGRLNIVLTGNTMTGLPNQNGNDGTIARFGWKAQNKSLLLFAGEAYNVEMGITNELFQTERDETPGCQFAKTPNDVANLDSTVASDFLSGIEKFAIFMRFLAPPTPSTTFPGGATSITRGKNLFAAIGCSACHTPTLTTGNSSVAALSNKAVNLYSDLMIHDMGAGLADGISQGQAGPTEFRTAPLWGLGQRNFFLHDGRTSDLVVAIQAHASPATRTQDGSEANTVVANYNRLSQADRQNLLNFLRSL